MALSSSPDVSALTHGAPTFIQDDLEVLEVHLHRYLAPFLIEHDLLKVSVVVGFEGSSVGTTCVEVTPSNAKRADTDVDFGAVAQAVRANLGSVSLSKGVPDGRRFTAIPAFSVNGSREHPNAFVLVDVGERFLGDAKLVANLSWRANEAVRAFRNNCIRILFGEQNHPSIKGFLYALLDRLPDWTGVDHSVALILTGNLEAITLDSMVESEFEIVAERLFFDKYDENNEKRDRLVGLIIPGRGSESGLLGHAFQKIKATPQIGLHIFIPNDETGDTWHVFGEPEAIAKRFATRVNRPVEAMTIMIPLLSQDEIGREEMLGFLVLNYRKPGPISHLTASCMESMARRLGGYLRQSTLFGLSARQLLLLDRVRGELVEATREGKEKPLESYIERVNSLIAASTPLPCFAVGHLEESDHGALLRFAHPHGFTKFGAIALPVELQDALEGSSVASLAVRLNRSVILAGGTSDDGVTLFNNEVYVNETLKRIVDARMVDPKDISSDGQWRHLSEYYKPSRESSYATLATPVSLGKKVYGVIAVEVDRQTDWLWWTGFGSQIFFRLLANELAVAFKMLGVIPR